MNLDFTLPKKENRSFPLDCLSILPLGEGVGGWVSVQYQIVLEGVTPSHWKYGSI